MKPEVVLFPQISFDFEGEHYGKTVERILRSLVPSADCTEETNLLEKLPLISWTPLEEPPFELTFFLWAPFRPNGYRFFYEMITRWLIPGKRLNALVQFATDFSLPEWGPQKYIAGEVKVKIETFKEIEILQKNLSTVIAEIRLGMESSYQACRILEIKGLTSDEKTALIQENIGALIRHRPQDFDYDILSEMQHFLVLCKEEFKEARSWKHMSRIICIHYLFRKTLKFALNVYPERRYINVKLMRANLNDKAKVIGMTIGMSYLKEYERFEAQHILSGIRALVPEARQVPGSFFCNQSQSDPTLTIYLEIEKENNLPIALEEERLLKAELPNEFKNRIEQRLNPLFMPQNEETVMRYIVTLSAELKYARDLPQVIIDFAQQTEDKLEFLVVIVRVGKPNLKSIASFFEAKPTFLEFVPDRTNTLGWARKKYTKEASVFHLRIRKEPFWRKDRSIDLVRARREIANELMRVVGEYRDYNGGTIAKENEVFEALRHSAGPHAFLLENYFYAINPPIMRSLLPAAPLKRLFSMLLESEQETFPTDLPYQIRMQYDEEYLYLLILARDHAFHAPLSARLKSYTGEIATCALQETLHPSFGLIFRGPEEEEALRLRLIVEQTMAELYLLTTAT